jgi:hypothetical protein
MVRVLLSKFPKGSYQGQRDDGLAIDRGLYNATKFIEQAALKYSMLGVIVVTGDPGTGKCQPAGSKVLMADGSWKNVEDIKVGDEVVSPQLDGTNIFAKVKNLSSWYCEDNYDVMEMNRQHKKLYSCSNNHLIPIGLGNKNVEAGLLFGLLKTGVVIESYIFDKKTKTMKPKKIKLEKSKPSQVYGFELDSPSSLYITDNWMVTHNSTLFSQLAKIVDPECTLENCHFSVEEFTTAIGESERVDKVQVQADDEATDLMSRSALESGNKKVLITLARMRSKKIVVFLMLPSFFDLDRTIAMFYTKMVVRCFNKGQLHRGYFQAWLGSKAVRELYLNGKKTYSYYKPKPNLKGQFCRAFCFPEPDYSNKKDAALLKMSKKESKASGKWKRQRNILLKILHDEYKMKSVNISQSLGDMSQPEISRILSGLNE